MTVQYNKCSSKTRKDSTKKYVLRRALKQITDSADLIFLDRLFKDCKCSVPFSFQTKDLCPRTVSKYRQAHMVLRGTKCRWESLEVIC